MPISSGANRWPKSYWTKPQPRLLTVAERVAERQSVQRHKPRTSSVDVPPSKPDTASRTEPSPPSDAEMERPAVRSTGVVVPPSTNADKQGNGAGLLQSRVVSTTVQETSSKSVFCPLKCDGFKRNVSRPTATFAMFYCRVSRVIKVLLTRNSHCTFDSKQLRSTFRSSEVC